MPRPLRAVNDKEDVLGQELSDLGKRGRPLPSRWKPPSPPPCAYSGFMSSASVSGSSLPFVSGATSYSMTPARFKASSGRSTELCSRQVVTAMVALFQRAEDGKVTEPPCSFLVKTTRSKPYPQKREDKSSCTQRRAPPRRARAYARFGPGWRSSAWRRAPRSSRRAPCSLPWRHGRDRSTFHLPNGRLRGRRLIIRTQGERL